MPDQAHVATDKILADLESKIADEYAKASRDMQKKYIAWAEQFAEQEKKQKALLDAGQITQKEYNDWRFRHEAIGKRWEDMKDVLAADLENARDIALKIAGEKMPDVYALNGNYAAYQIEHDAGIDAEDHCLGALRQPCHHLLCQRGETPIEAHHQLPFAVCQGRHDIL